MRSKAKTDSKLPRAKLLAVLDRAYDRLAIAQSDTEVMEALGKLCGVSESSKEFIVTILSCEKPSHAGKIKKVIRDSFLTEERYSQQPDKRQTNFSMRVKADSETSIRAAIAPFLGKAKARIAEIIWSKPRIYRRFVAPGKKS